MNNRGLGSESRGTVVGARSGRAGATVLALLFVAVALSGCRERGQRGRQGQAAATKPVRGGTLVIDAPSDLDMTNSLVTSDALTQEVDRYLLFMPLVRFSKTMGYEPYLARSWQARGDTLMIFHLRTDVHWSDGQRVTAHDVTFTFDRLKDARTASPAMSDFQKWSSAVATDDFTVVMRHFPDSDPLASWATMPIMPRHALDSIPAERLRQAAFNRHPVTDGPFRFVSETPNTEWVFAANPDFPVALGGRPYLDRVVWKVVPEASAELTDLRTGQAQLVLNMPASQIPMLKQRPGLRVLTRPSRKYALIAWNGRRPPLNQAGVRRALTLAINRTRILKALRAGIGVLATGPIPPYHWAYDDSIKPLPYDTTEALRLLARAGYTHRNGNGVLVGPGGKPLVLQLLIPADNATNRDMAEMIRSDLAQVGVRLDVQPLDYGTIVARLTSPKRDFDGALLGWEANYRLDLDLRQLYATSALGGPYQFSSYSNPRFDAALDSAAAATSKAAAKPWWHRVQRILRDDEPASFLYYYPDILAVSDRLQGESMDIRGILATIRHWWLEPAGRSVSP